MYPNFSEEIKTFYENFISQGSNINDYASLHDLTNTECYTLIKIGERIVNSEKK